ncbi:MAG: CAP domain-containing protein [Ilumatobacteraceae bacterium]
MAVLSVVAVSPASAASPPFIDPSSDWLTTVNYFRAMGGQSPVVDDATLSVGAFNHSCYMLQNGIAHDEIPGKPGYTPDGDVAGNSGNVAVSSAFNESARSHIELWMTGPFHAIGVLRPGLQRVGFGKCDNEATTPWRSGATLNVISGLGTAAPLSQPILFPGNGTTTSLNRFITESPNPVTACGWTGAAGLPIIAMMPEGFAGNPTATISGPNGPIETCVLSSANTTGVSQQILAGDKAVIVMPRTPLANGTHAVTVTTSARTVSWSFTVDPTAATGILPVSITVPLGTEGGATLQPVAPSRIVDTRSDMGATRLVGGLGKRIQIAGGGGVPGGAEAVSANFTISESSGGGYLTVWNCSADRPVVSTLNFGTGDAVPNGASVPLDSRGGLCVYSSVAADLIIDVNGYYAASGNGRFASVTPARLLDTRIDIGRRAANTVTPLRVTGIAGVPTGAEVVSLNVTSVDPAMRGYVTVYPCDVSRPTTSSLNPVPGQVKPNVVLAPVAADGTVCLYTSVDVDLVVDITGYVAESATLKLTSTTPFRLTDTRDRNRPEMNGGLAGNALAAGNVLVIQVAGSRGIASNAQAVSANFTVTGGASSGYLSAWPCGVQPTTSTVNFAAADAIANGAQMPLSASGQLCVMVSSNAHVVIDINGWWA